MNGWAAIGEVLLAVAVGLVVAAFVSIVFPDRDELMMPVTGQWWENAR